MTHKIALFYCRNLAYLTHYSNLFKILSGGNKRLQRDLPVTKMKKKNKIKKKMLRWQAFISRRNRLNTYVIKNPYGIHHCPRSPLPSPFTPLSEKKGKKIEWKRPWGEMHNSKSEKGKCLPTFEKIKLMTRKLEWTAKFAIHFKTGWTRDSLFHMNKIVVLRE